MPKLKKPTSIYQSNLEIVISERTELLFEKLGKKPSLGAMASIMGYDNPVSFYQRFKQDPQTKERIGEFEEEKVKKLAEYIDCSVDYLSRRYASSKLETYHDYLRKEEMRNASMNQEMVQNVFALYGDSSLSNIVNNDLATREYFLEQLRIAASRTLYFEKPDNSDLIKDHISAFFIKQNLFEPYDENDDQTIIGLATNPVFKEFVITPELSSGDAAHIDMMKELFEKIQIERKAKNPSNEKLSLLWNELIIQYLTYEGIDLRNIIMQELTRVLEKVSKDNKAAGQPTTHKRKGEKKNE